MDRNIVHINGRNYQIGESVQYRTSYSTNPHSRFPGGGVPYPQAARPLRTWMGKECLSTGYVIGVRSVIMTCTAHEYSCGEDPGLRKGTKELVLLVTQNIRKAPVLVRPEDIEVPE